jgi:multisubunit Na+/H+ antiporter MnhB subunit
VYDDGITAYIMAGVVLAYTAILFYILYRLIPLKCIEGEQPKETEEQKSADDKNELLGVIIISIVFFVSIFAMFAPLFHAK